MTLTTNFPPHKLSFTLTKVDELPNFCIKIAELLQEQEAFIETSSRYTNKILPLEDWNDRSIFSITCESVIKFMETNQKWHVNSYDSEKYYDPNDNPIHPGVELLLINKESLCSLKTLEESYNQAVESMKTKWEEVTLEECSNMMFSPDNPKEYTLYLKKEVNMLSGERGLICHLASKFSLFNEMQCHNLWHETPGPGHYYGDLYLWIKNSALEEFTEKFSFQL